MRKLFYIFVILCMPFFVFVSCGTKQLPDGVLDESTMVDLLCDVYMIEGYFSDQTDFKPFLMAEEVVESYSDIMDKYQINDSVFEASFRYYMEDYLRFDSINAKVMDKLNDKMARW